jgi:hypothetical protein
MYIFRKKKKKNNNNNNNSTKEELEKKKERAVGQTRIFLSFKKNAFIYFF